MAKRTIEVEDKAVLEFAFRPDANTLRENAKSVKVNIDLSKLSAEDLLEWAYSAMIVGFQSKLRSKNPPELEKDSETGTFMYKWTVPSRGTRSTTDPKKIEEAASKLLSKMDESGKKELLYKTLISMGKTEAEATAISGYAKPTAVTPEVVKSK